MRLKHTNMMATVNFLVTDTEPKLVSCVMHTTNIGNSSNTIKVLQALGIATRGRTAHEAPT